MADIISKPRIDLRPDEETQIILALQLQRAGMAAETKLSVIARLASELGYRLEVAGKSYYLVKD